MRKRILGLACVALWLGMVAGVEASAQDFQKSYTLNPEGSIRIRTISGDIKVQGYDGAKVTVDGFKVGKNCEGVEVVDRSAENRIDLNVLFHRNSNCDMNFQVRVPRAASYSFDPVRTISGDVWVGDVSGKLQAETVSGLVEVRNVRGVVSVNSTSGNVLVVDIAGTVTASSVSGDVDVTFSGIDGSGDMKFSSVSGNVIVRAPESLDASISMSTMSGGLKTDFPIQIEQRRYVPGSTARGRLGAGTRSIVIRAVSGRVSLLKKQQ